MKKKKFKKNLVSSIVGQWWWLQTISLQSIERRGVADVFECQTMQRNKHV